MQDILALVYTYALGVWRFRWPALICAWVLSIAGWIFVYQMEDAYQATARIYVDNNTVLGPLLRGLAIQPNINQRLSLMTRTLLSRPNLEKLMRMTDLDLEVRTEAEAEEFLNEFRKRISIKGDRRNRSLYSISFVDEERDTAKRIVQALITVFIESSLGDKREDSSDAQAFLDEQIADYEIRLIEAEQRLADFRQRNMGTLDGNASGYYQRLAGAKEQLEVAQLQLNELRNRGKELRRQLDGEEPVMLSNSGGQSSNSPIDARIAALQVSMDNLLSRYTEKHPEVRQIRALIAALEVERAQEIDQLLAGDTDSYSGMVTSPVYEGMRAMLAETEANVASLETRVQEYDRRVKDLEDKVSNIPVIETELKQLDRDYGVIRGQHSKLLQRRESALMSQKVEQNANDVTFRVIDPPFVPTRPSEPNKLLLSAAVLFAGIGAGIGIALLLSLLNPRIYEQRSLSNLTGLPMLGTVSVIENATQKRQSLIALTTFTGLAVLLFAMFAGVAAITQGMVPGV
ncbi:chain length-determining protein [Halieaceae bacterium IMCC14734]|uniref:Chain length-determining protein n=1 Tax=Candidatus Litorirhabdus singularis TaxID=2518993 RepID=A0ABT3THR7_9GAMM|nr:XrtA system polysaccharide chain length determinant [Candidatus Litorirhabdus singularis]MCX2981286.1 chain length-determining protein [Candidatus Litorirhabdus singularis]